VNLLSAGQPIGYIAGGDVGDEERGGGAASINYQKSFARILRDEAVILMRNSVFIDIMRENDHVKKLMLEGQTQRQEQQQMQFKQ